VLAGLFNLLEVIGSVRDQRVWNRLGQHLWLVALFRPKHLHFRLWGTCPHDFPLPSPLQMRAYLSAKINFERSVSSVSWILDRFLGSRRARSRFMSLLMSEAYVVLADYSKCNVGGFDPLVCFAGPGGGVPSHAGAGAGAGAVINGDAGAGVLRHDDGFDLYEYRDGRGLRLVGRARMATVCIVAAWKIQDALTGVEPFLVLEPLVKWPSRAVAPEGENGVNRTSYDATAVFVVCWMDSTSRWRNRRRFWMNAIRCNPQLFMTSLPAVHRLFEDLSEIEFRVHCMSGWFFEWTSWARLEGRFRCLNEEKCSNLGSLVSMVLSCEQRFPEVWEAAVDCEIWEISRVLMPWWPGRRPESACAWFWGHLSVSLVDEKDWRRLPDPETMRAFLLEGFLLLPGNDWDGRNRALLTEVSGNVRHLDTCRQQCVAWSADRAAWCGAVAKGILLARACRRRSSSRPKRRVGSLASKSV
jgi:hypothetical protein